MKAVLAARRRFYFGVLLFLFVGDMHLWDGHVFVVDVFFFPGILLSACLARLLAGMYFRYSNIFIANVINRFLFLLLHFQNIQMLSKSSLMLFHAVHCFAQRGSNKVDKKCGNKAVDKIRKQTADQDQQVCLNPRVYFRTGPDIGHSWGCAHAKLHTPEDITAAS